MRHNQFRSVSRVIILLIGYTCSPLSAAEKPPAPPLVQRNAIRLQEAGAQVVLDAAIAKAKEMKLNVSVTVLDEAGQLYRFARMDGARPISVYTSQTKAASAINFRAETGPIMAGETVNLHLSLAVEHAAQASGGKFTSLKGGVPLVVDGQVIGAVGVGGATGEQDQEIARAAAKALADALAK
jgi:glc operon protein GlcG